MNVLIRDDVAPVIAMYLEFEFTGRGRALAIEIAVSIHGDADLQAGLAELCGNAGSFLKHEMSSATKIELNDGRRVDFTL
jgi:hypothetical protein